MRIPEIYNDILKEYLAATRAKNISWTKVNDNAFAHVSDDITFEVREGVNDNETLWAGASIRNAAGETVDSFWIDDDEPGYEILRELFGAAKRSALKVDETIEKLRARIRGTMGKQ